MFRHPSAATSRAYGCGCGCNSCGGKAKSYGAYGAALSAGLPFAARWNFAKEAKDLTIACKDFDKAVEEYLKAKERFDDTRSFLGLRVGGEGTKVDSAVDAMKKWKGKGKLALTKCRNREIDTAIGGTKPQGPSDRDFKTLMDQFNAPVEKQISGGGTQRFSEGTSPLVYVIGATAVGLVGVGAFLVWKKSQGKEAAA